MKMYDTVFICINNIRYNIKRLLFSIISLSLFILSVNMSIFYLMSLQEGFLKNVENNDSLKFVQIESGKIEKEFTNADILSISDIDGVVCVFPRTTVKIKVNDNAQDINVMLLGIPDKALKYFIEGGKLFKNKNDIYVSFLYKDALKRDYISMSLLTDTNNEKKIDANIAGFYNNKYILDFEKGISLAGLEFVNNINALYSGVSKESYLENTKFDKYIIVVNDVLKVQDVIKRLKGRGYSTYSALDGLKTIPSISKVVIIIGLLLVFLFGLISIVSTILIIKEIFQNRKKYIGIMMTVGFSSKYILRLMLIELFIISLISFAVTSVISFILMPIFGLLVGDISIKTFLIVLSLNFPILALMVVISCFNFVLKLSRENVVELLKAH